MIGSNSSTDFIRTSIEECERKSGKSHKNCTLNHESPLPTRVLDVRDGMVKLIDSPVGVGGKYCTLSYRWGPLDFNFKTVRENLDQMRKCVPWDKLQPLVKDAVTIIRQLNVPYLWIDALCIIQEDKDGECLRYYWTLSASFLRSL
jgi:Heterokaryon incompatibility protein (HET)